jgi:CO/xanthine dehydrogenase Mo-binding subunit
MSSHLDDNVIPASRQREAPRKGMTWIGKGMKRIEDPRILTGKGRYVDDVSVQNMAHAAMVHSPHAHARIVSIDISKALEIPGVIGVFVGEDIARLTDPCPSFASPPVPQLCMAVGKVRHVGEVVAAVVADDRYIAEDAAELVDVTYDILPANVDMEEALAATGDALIHAESFDSNCPLDQSFAFGPVDEDFARASHIVRRRLRWPRSSAQAMETCGCIADFDQTANSYTIHCNTNFYNFIPWVLAGSLKVAPTQLKLLPVAIGGSFGSKVFTHKIIILTCALARAVGQPVKYIEDRLAHFLNSDSHGSDRLYDAELAFDDAGKMLSLRFHVLDDYGAYLQFGVGTHGNAMAQVTGAYRIPSFGMRVQAVLTNKCQQGPYRGFGSEVTNWVIERLVDAAAEELKIDRVELRLRNMIQPDEFPYMLPTGNIYDSGNFQAVLAEAKRLIDWDSWESKIATMRAQGKYVGMGITTCMERSVYSPTEWWSLNKIETPGFTLSSTPEGVSVRIDGSGKLFVQLNSPFIGNSPETVTTQILCEQFDVQPGDIQIAYSDSQSGFNGIGPQGSRFTAMIAGALVSASIKLKARLMTFAAHHLQRKADDLELKDGHIVSKENPAAKVSIGEIALLANFFRLNFPDHPDYDSGLEVTAVYDHPLATLPHPERKHLGIFYPIVGHVCHIAVVEVDVDTGQTHILDYAAVHDNGTIVNPLTLAGQVLGGTCNGIGSTFYEEFIHDSAGQFVNPNFAEYGIPTANEMPANIKIGHVETPSPFTEYGVKGGGEGGRLAAPSALSSAVDDALKPFGVFVDRLPLPPARLYQIIHGA